MRELRLSRADWVDAIEKRSFDEIRADPGLMEIVSQTGPVLFTDNCSGCHGAEAQGGPGFPSLTDLDWLWGGDEDAIMETLRVGINAPHPETRVAQMMAFGRDGILTRDQVRTVVDYVMSLSVGSEVDPDRLAEGAGLFADNCAACHGEDAKGLREMGAPNLTDDIWLYGGDADALFHTVHNGRQGWMPAWEDRMSLADRKILTLYLQQLAGGTQQ